MTQLSVQYACSPVTGDYGNLTVENLAAMNLFLGNVHNTETGVVYWTDASYVPQVTTSTGSLSNPVNGLLEPTEAAGVVSIDTGVANVNGYLYFNDVSEDFDIDGNPGNANATDIIALRWTATSQTVRLVRLNGAVGATAVLTQSSTVWEVAIAEVLLDGSGNFSALTDVRKLAIAPGTIIKIGEFVGDGVLTTCSFTNIPAIFSHLKIIGAIANPTGSNANMILRANGDSGNNYDFTNHRADGTTGGVTTSTLAGSSIDYGSVPGTNAANYVSSIVIDIPMYSSDIWYKPFSAQAGFRTTTVLTVSNIVGVWKNVTPITQLDFTLSGAIFSSGSRLDLYGVA